MLILERGRAESAVRLTSQVSPSAQVTEVWEERLLLELFASHPSACAGAGDSTPMLARVPQHLLAGFASVTKRAMNDFLKPTKPLTGKRIAFCGARRSVELSALIEKLGAVPLSRPMMVTESLDSPNVAEALTRFAQEGADWLVATTGMGMRAMREVAAALGVEEDSLARLSRAKLAVRGYKTVRALKEMGLKPDVLDDDGTLEGLRRQLEPIDFTAKHVAVQLHGTRVPELTDWLAQRGASVLEIPLYQYQEPSEDEVRRFVCELNSGEIDAAAFTSNTQVFFLFAVAEQLGLRGVLQGAFSDNVQAVSVGHMTTKALHDAGIEEVIAPEQERMGAMMMAFAERVRAQGR